LGTEHKLVKAAWGGEPRQRATRPKMLWTMKKPKLCGLKGSTPTTPRSSPPLDMVRWELSLLRLPGVASGGVDPEMSFDEIRALQQNPRNG
jgi:hypothetical protein